MRRTDDVFPRGYGGDAKKRLARCQTSIVLEQEQTAVDVGGGSLNRGRGALDRLPSARRRWQPTHHAWMCESLLGTMKTRG